jgi:hypothetical protein
LILAACSAVLLSSCDKDGKEKSPYDKYAVDLGLSVKWASVNVGASTEMELGNYYGWDSYQVFEGIGTDDASRDAALARIYDSNLKLKSEYDVASVQWGVSWRMPTFDEFEDHPGGWKVTSKVNGESIFIPAVS